MKSKEKDYFSDGRKLFSHVGECSTFAEFVRKLLLEILNSKKINKKAADRHDKQAFEAINQFLRAEGQAPLDASEFEQVPVALEEVLQKLFSGPELNAQRHVFNSGKDASERGRNPKRQAHLAKFFEALSNYYTARHPNRESCPEMKLWKKEVEVEDGKVIASTIREVDHIDPQELAVLRIPGLSNIHRREDMREYHIRTAEMMLGGDAVYTEPPNNGRYNFYILSYPYKDRMAFSSEIHGCNADASQYVTPVIRSFVNKVLLPSYGINEGVSNKSAAELKASFRKLTLLSNSYGSVVALQMQTACAERLKELGYSQQAVREALPNIYHQAILPVNRIDESVPDWGAFSTFYVVSSNDLTPFSRTNMKDFTPNSYAGAKNSVINPHTMLRWVDAPVQGKNLTFAALEDMESLTPQEREERLNIPSIAPQQGHDPELAMHDIETPDGQVFKNSLIRYALRRGLNRSDAAPDLVREWAEKMRVKRPKEPPER